MSTERDVDRFGSFLAEATSLGLSSTRVDVESSK